MTNQALVETMTGMSTETLEHFRTYGTDVEQTVAQILLRARWISEAHKGK